LSDTVRDQLYQPFQNPHSDTALLNRLRHARQMLEIEWFTLAADAPLVGHSIGSAAIRRQTGALIVSLIRDGTIEHNSVPELVLEAGTA
jgi:CPA2 family monovalent cation:H+ antiporter-2